MESITQGLLPFKFPVSKTRLHRVWRGMHERCTYQNHKSYAYYGGRGIAVCEEWNDFAVFEEWALANGYREGLKLDRKDNDGPYAPKNCRFVTHEVNCNNTRYNVIVSAFGEQKSLSRWERDSRCKVSKNTIRRRIAAGVEPETAITVPMNGKIDGFYSGLRYLTAWGETKLLKDWADDSRCKVPLSALRFRDDEGWPAEEAISAPSGWGRMRDGERLTAFGETKLVSQWAADSRCVVKENCLRMRVKEYGWTPELAITTPSGVKPSGEFHARN